MAWLAYLERFLEEYLGELANLCGSKGGILMYACSADILTTRQTSHHDSPLLSVLVA